MSVKPGVLAAALLVGASWVSAVPGAAQLRTFSGSISKFDGADNDNSACTQSGAYKDLQGMSVTFTQGGSTLDEVIILFQAGSWFSEVRNFADLRLLVDGVVQPGPGFDGNLFVYGADFDTEAQSRSHGFNFVSQPLGPGPHTAKIQWRVFKNLNQICAGPRSMVVLHR